MMGKATGVFFAITAMMIMVTNTNAFLEPFASKFMAKKMLLKHGFQGGALPAAPPPVQYGTLFYGGHFEHHPKPSPLPPPHPSYPAYGPEPSSPSYGPPSAPSYGPPSAPSYGPPSAPSYGPPSAPNYGPSSFSGYEQPASPPVVVKPHPPSNGCLPASNPTPQVDYSGYTVHGGYAYGNNNGNYGNNGNAGSYGK